MSYPERLEILPLDKPPHATIRVPGSKSITNRALVLAALAAKGFGYALRGALRSEDTEVMIDGLRALGFRVMTDWPDAVVCVESGEDEPAIPATSANLFLANSGTSMRFLTALVSLGHGRFRLDGVARMRERPIEDLLQALRQLGAAAVCENNNGCPPVVVEANGLSGGPVRIKGNLSSQFLSGLLMVAPLAANDVHVEVDGLMVSEPYVTMTLKMLGQFGFAVTDVAPDKYWIPGRQAKKDLDKIVPAAAFHDGFDPRRHILLQDYFVEPDASAASYFWGAAAVTGGDVSVPQLHKHSLQGDVRFLDLLDEMGCRVEVDKTAARVAGASLRGIEVDMNDISDTVMTLAAVACFAEGPTTIRNVAHIRHKETDRLAALATELRKVGAEVTELPDGLKITPRVLHGAEIETYNDHRMAMSMALVGLRVPGIVIKNPGCVAKTYPEFWQDLEKLRC